MQSTGNPNATQGFIWKEVAWPPGLLERNKVVSFAALFFMFTLTWITEKERVIERRRKGRERKRRKKMKRKERNEKKRKRKEERGKK